MTKSRIYTTLAIITCLVVAVAIYCGTAYLIQFKFGVYYKHDMILSYLLAGALWSVLIPVMLFSYAAYAAFTDKPLPPGPTRSTINDSCDCPCIVVCL